MTSSEVYGGPGSSRGFCLCGRSTRDVNTNAVRKRGIEVGPLWPDYLVTYARSEVTNMHVKRMCSTTLGPEFLVMSRSGVRFPSPALVAGSVTVLGRLLRGTVRMTVATSLCVSLGAAASADQVGQKIRRPFREWLERTLTALLL
jgi:hypothetical protein